MGIASKIGHSKVSKALGVGVLATSLSVTGMSGVAQAAPGDNVIPDDALRACLNTTKLSKPAADSITQTQAASITGSVSCNNMPIASVAGLEYVANASYFYLQGASNTYEDLVLAESTPNLRGVFTNGSLKLKSVKLPTSAPLLEDMRFNGTSSAARTSLTELEIPANYPNLQRVEAQYGQLTKVTGLEKAGILHSVLVNHNQLDESGFQLPAVSNSLSSFNVQSNKFTKFTVPETAPALQSIYVHGNQLTELNLPGTYDRVNTIYAHANKLSHFDATKVPNVSTMFLGHSDAGLTAGNKFTSLNDINGFANLEKLKTFRIDNNQLTDVSPAAALTGLTSFNARNQTVSDFDGWKWGSNATAVTNRDGSKLNLDLVDAGGNAFAADSGVAFDPATKAASFSAPAKGSASWSAGIPGMAAEANFFSGKGQFDVAAPAIDAQVSPVKNEAMTVSWAAVPLATGYKVTIDNGKGDKRTEDVTNLSTTFKSLAPGTTYQVTVAFHTAAFESTPWAKNVAVPKQGGGPVVSVLKPNQKPAKAKVAKKSGGKKFVVTWKKPANTSKQRPVTKYILTVQVRGKKKVILTKNLSSKSTKYTLTRKQLLKALKVSTRGEINKIVFVVKIRAANQIGTGPAATKYITVTL